MARSLVRSLAWWPNWVVYWHQNTTRLLSLIVNEPPPSPPSLLWFEAVSWGGHCIERESKQLNWICDHFRCSLSKLVHQSRLNWGSLIIISINVRLNQKSVSHIESLSIQAPTTGCSLIASSVSCLVQIKKSSSNCCLCPLAIAFESEAPQAAPKAAPTSVGSSHLDPFNYVPCMALSFFHWFIHSNLKSPLSLDCFKIMSLTLMGLAYIIFII